MNDELELYRQALHGAREALIVMRSYCTLPKRGRAVDYDAGIKVAQDAIDAIGLVLRRPGDPIPECTTQEPSK